VRICDFLLVCQSNIGPILHRFRGITGFLLMTPPLFHPKFGEFPLDQIGHAEVAVSRNLKLISRAIIFEVFQPLWKTYLLCRKVPHRGTGSSGRYQLWHISGNRLKDFDSTGGPMLILSPLCCACDNTQHPARCSSGVSFLATSTPCPEISVTQAQS